MVAVVTRTVGYRRRTVHDTTLTGKATNIARKVESARSVSANIHTNLRLQSDPISHCLVVWGPTWHPYGRLRKMNSPLVFLTSTLGRLFYPVT
jgi:hypothetical protein